MRYCECPSGFKESPNPREPGCVSCHKFPHPGIRASDEVVREHFERLKEMLESSGTIAAPPTPRPDWDHFVYMCLQRIEKGAAEYGAANFLRSDVDLVKEACEETFDLCIYALLEVIKTEPDPVDAVALGQAAYYAFLSYQNFLRYRAKLRGSSG